MLKTVYHFGPFRLDCEERLFCCEGRRIPVTSPRLDTLLALVEGKGRVLTKEELMQAVWPDLNVEEGKENSRFMQLNIPPDLQPLVEKPLAGGEYGSAEGKSK